MGVIESVQQYDLNIPAGGAQNIDVAGDRVQFLSAVDPFAQIEIRPNYAQGNISLKPGQGFRFSEQVTRWVVFNRGSVALSGYLLIGSGDFFDQRIAGTVDVIDGGKARTLSNQAFIGGNFQVEVAANYSHVQLWNPAGSGKNLVLEAVRAKSSGAPWTADFRLYSSALAASADVPVNKNLGGAAGVGQFRAQALATQTFDGGAGSLLTLSNSAAAGSDDYKFTEPVVIVPGKGVVVFTYLVNTSLTVSFEWYEETAS